MTPRDPTHLSKTIIPIRRGARPLYATCSVAPAQHYNLANQIFSFGSGAWYRHICLQKAGVRQGVRVVDIREAMLAIAQWNLGIP